MDSGLAPSRAPRNDERREPSSFQGSNSRYAIAFPQRDYARVIAAEALKKIERAQGMPGEGLTHGPPAERNAGGRYHRCSRSTGIPCAVALRLLRDLPGDRLD